MVIRYIIKDNCLKYWYQNGRYHRLDGPAIEYVSGEKNWCQYGELHRTDGPAIEYPDGTKLWFIEGRAYTKEEYNRRISKR
jgi:hypothetical protein